MRPKLRIPVVALAAAICAAGAHGAPRAPEGDYARIDAAVRSMRSPRTVDEVAAAIAAAARSDGERARGAFTWIAENIDYDVDSFFGRSDPVVDPEGVFRARKSVCAGYAALYASIAGRLGLETVTISGRSKGYGEKTGDRDIPVNHDWNAVRFGGAWRLVDATWGAGSVDEAGIFERDFSAFWFDCEPRLFALWHLPEDSAWQLLAEPVSYRAYLAEPKYRNGDYERLFAAGIPPERILAWHRAGRMPDAFDVQSIAGLGFPAASLVAWVEAGSLPELYDVKTLSGYGIGPAEMAAAVDAGGLVECWSFADLGLKILDAPLRRTIEAGRTVTFAFETSTPAEIALDNNEEWTYLKKSGDRMEAVLAPRAGELSAIVHTRYKGELSWWVFLKYEVR